MYDFLDYLHVAERLASSNDEGDQRSAISRAYYAVFHRARAFVRAEGYFPNRKRLGHQEIWEALRDDADGARSQVGRRGGNLHALRRNADYDGQIAGDVAQRARDAIEEARELIELIDRL